MDRWSVLDQLNDNWPGKFPQGRLAFLEKDLRDFDDDVLQKGIQAVLRTSEYPPTLAAVRTACVQANASKAPHRGKRTLRPGDVDPTTGERFMTGREAARALHQLCSEHPEVLQKTPRDMTNKAGIELAVRKILANGYRRCIQADGGSIPLEYAGQQELL